MSILINSIPHTKQRYETVGDWDFLLDNLLITVSEMKPRKYQFLVIVHELIEAILCYERDIHPDKVTKFDMDFKGKGEPGDSKKAPYRKEHQFATKIEKMLAKELGVDWKKYCDTIDSL